MTENTNNCRKGYVFTFILYLFVVLNESLVICLSYRQARSKFFMYCTKFGLFIMSNSCPHFLSSLFSPYFKLFREFTVYNSLSTCLAPNQNLLSQSAHSFFSKNLYSLLSALACLRNCWNVMLALLSDLTLFLFSNSCYFAFH